MITACLLGAGGTMPLPGRWLTALYARLGALGVLVDCGEGTQIAAREARVSLNDIDIICVTHFHADHIAGLPGLLLSMAKSSRVDKVLIIGPRGIEAVARCLMVISPGLPFEIEFAEIDGERREFLFGNVRLTAFPLAHGMPCYGYEIAVERAGKFMPNAAREQNIPVEYWKTLQSGQSAGGFSPSDVLGPARRGLKLVYATDTRPVPELLARAEGADLLIIEGMYDTDDKLGKAIENQHLLFSEAAEIAKTARAREMWLTHFSPSLTDPEAGMERVRAVFPNALAGYGGLRKELVFDE